MSELSSCGRINMKIENQVVSLKLAKELKEAGWKQSGIFSWAIDTDNKWGVFFDIPEDGDEWYKEDDGIIVAPTATELGEELPSTLFVQDTGHLLRILKTNDIGWVVMFESITGYKMKSYIEHKLADALARMWLYIKREALI